MVHPRNRPSLSTGVEAFFAENLGEGLPAETKSSTIVWRDPVRRPRDKGGYIITWQGRVPGMKLPQVIVRAVQEDMFSRDFTWCVALPVIRIQGHARTKNEAFEMATRAVYAVSSLNRHVGKLRRLFREVPPPRPTEEEERAFKVTELLVGARPRYTPIRGTRAWSLREDDIPESRKEDWNRHGHTVCSMLRDLIR